jgi:very-short-patch-repair endonuclease
LRGRDEKRAERARSLRRALTPAEFTLWTHIRGRQLGRFKFVRQEPIDRYYADFVYRERRLIIELDGGQHAERLTDRQRDGKLCALGYRVIRIWTTSLRIWTEYCRHASRSSQNSLTPSLSPQTGQGR